MTLIINHDINHDDSSIDSKRMSMIQSLATCNRIMHDVKHCETYLESKNLTTSESPASKAQSRPKQATFGVGRWFMGPDTQLLG